MVFEYIHPSGIKLRPNSFLFVEDVYCVLADPATMDLSDFDADVIDCMNIIANDIRDLL